MSGPDGCPANGSFDASLMMSCAGQIMISHLNGNFFAIAARRVDSLTFLRTTNVPTAPMLTTPNCANCLAISAGWQRLALPTFTARRKTTEGTGEYKMETPNAQRPTQKEGPATPVSALRRLRAGSRVR